MDKKNNFVYDREQKDLEQKLENDNLTLKEQIQKLQETIKKMKCEVIDYSQNIENSKLNNNASQNNISIASTSRIEKTENNTNPVVPNNKPLSKKNKKEVERINSSQLTMKKTLSNVEINEEENKRKSSHLDKHQENHYEISRKKLDESNKLAQENNEDEVRFSFNNDKYKKNSVANDNTYLPNKYLEIEVHQDYEISDVNKEFEENKIENFDFKKTKQRNKKEEIENFDRPPLITKDSNKVFNFTDSSDENEDNFFSSPKLTNQNDTRNQNLSLKEKRYETNKSFKNNVNRKNNERKMDKKEIYKQNTISKEEENNNDTLNSLDKNNITRKSIREKNNVSSPKIKRDNIKSSKAKITIDPNKNKKKTTTPLKSKNLKRSVSRSRSKSRKGLNIKKNKEVVRDKDNEIEYKKENEKLKEENKKLRDENKQLKILLDKEKIKNEKFNYLAEEFLKFYE